MNPLSDLKTITSLVENLSTDLSSEIVDELKRCICEPPSQNTSNDGYAYLLTQLTSKLFSNINCKAFKELLLFSTENAQADEWLDILIIHIQRVANPAILNFQLTLLSKFISSSRLGQFYQCLMSKIENFSANSRSNYLIERTRLLINLTTIVSNALKSSPCPRLFKNEVYFPLLLSRIPFVTPFRLESAMLSAILVSQLCFLGHSKIVWHYIFQSIRRKESIHFNDLWSSTLLYIPIKSFEVTVMSLFRTAEHPDIIFKILSKFIDQNDPLLQFDQLITLFHRALLLQRFSTHRVPINIFGFLKEFVLHLKKKKMYELAQQICSRVNNDLGFRILQVWADKTALQRSSLTDRICINQSLASWISEFRKQLPNDCFTSENEPIVSCVLSGISAHLSCNKEDQRIVGMAVGEWLVQVFNIGLASTSATSTNCLKFQYKDNAIMNLIRPHFSSSSVEDVDTSKESETLNEFFEVENILQQSIIPSQLDTVDTDNLDSDDDPDMTDFSFEPLPTLPKLSPQPEWPYTSRKPHYLRECLDGLSLAKEDEHEVALSCFAHAEEMIYKHKNAVYELAIPFAESLLHTEPPACPFIQKVNKSRHDALVALTVVAPKPTANYLTSQFTLSGLALNQRYEILACLTDSAYVLATGFETTPFPIQADGDKPTAPVNPNTRRFCTPSASLVKQKQTENKFAKLASYFFFPLIAAIPKLANRSEADVYVHLDDSLLSRLIACLGSIYACARNSPKLVLMAENLISVSKDLLRHPDAVVRRSSLSSIGVILTVTPINLFASHTHLLYSSSDCSLLEHITKVLDDDSDVECRQLAVAVFLSLKDNIAALSPNLPFIENLSISS